MGINIQLFDDWRIRSDSRQYMLVQGKGDYEEIQGYYSNLDNLIEAFIDKKIKGFNATSIKSLQSSINSLAQACQEAIRPLKLKVIPQNEYENLKEVQDA